MKKTWRLFLFFRLLLAASGVPALQFSYQTLDYPTASAAFGGTAAQGVFGGNIVGTYFDSGNQAHGFLYDGNNFSSLDAPNSFTNGVGSNIYFGTYALGISGGEIVGWYTSPDTAIHGFSLSGGAYTVLQEPNDYLNTVATSVSGGAIVGNFTDINGLTHGFALVGTNYTTLDVAAAAALGNGTYPSGVDGANIVGYYQLSANHGFLYNGSTYTTVDFPNTVGFTEATGISGTNIVGFYEDAGGNTHSFLFDGATYTSFDYPGSSHTFAACISSNTIAGYYVDSSSHTHGFIATISSGLVPPATGAVEVTITPAGAVTNGAQWQVDGGAFQISGAVVTNLSIGHHTVSFNTISNWTTPTNQAVTVTTNFTNMVIGLYVQQALAQAGSLQVTIDPAGAVSAGAEWQVDGGTFQNSGSVVTNLSIGNHLVSFNQVFGWNAPSNQTIEITNGITTMDVGQYMAWAVPADGLVLVTNGSGIIQQKNWPATLVGGSQYTVKAVPAFGSAFLNWVGGTNLPLTVLSTSPSYTFTMQPGLLLQANFIINPFLTAHGAYQGLIAPADGPRDQTNSGWFYLVLTTTGTLSGQLHVGGKTVPLTGKVGPDGSAQITSKWRGSSLLTMLQMDFGNQSLAGTVSNSEEGFTSQLTGYQEVYNAKNPATNYAGRYSLVIPGTTNPAVGPYGASYGTVLVKPSGTITFTGSLADGTPVRQSSMILAGGNWPLYLSLYGGTGSLLSWINLTNGSLISPSASSWINPTNLSKTADYRSGFTNQNMSVTGGLYDPANQPFILLESGALTMSGGDLSALITNVVTLASSYQLVFTSVTNNVTLTINPTTGLISGSFRNPSNSTKLIPIYGILEPGHGNATGYFSGTTESGLFALTPQ